VYRADNREEGEKALNDFLKKWKSAYPKVTKSLMENPYLLTFYKRSFLPRG
jgi:putative transposase